MHQKKERGEDATRLNGVEEKTETLFQRRGMRVFPRIFLVRQPLPELPGAFIGVSLLEIMLYDAACSKECVE